MDPGLITIGLADLGVELFGERARLLESEDIGLFGGEPLGKTLAAA